MHPIKTPKKLIETSLPLDAINVAAAREKSIRHGHPSTLHLWWARRPLAAARAVIFAQMVNDPGYERHLGRGMNKEKAQAERERLFGIIRRLVLWENTNNEAVLNEARAEIWASWRETCALNKDHPEAATLFNPEKLPAFHDPFAGGGALPLEAQRLGLESHASDLNPVAVLINKAMIEIPPKFAGRPPVGPRLENDKQSKLSEDWSGAKGLAEDVRRYGAWMREEAFKRIGHLYPQVDLPAEYGGGKGTVIAWIWARTVKSPNPAFAQAAVPLASTFVLSAKAGKEAWVEPLISGLSYSFKVHKGKIPSDAINGTVTRKGGICLLSGSPMDFKYLRAEAKNGRFGVRLMAMVADGPHGRAYVSPTAEHEEIALSALRDEGANVPICHWPGRTNVVEYGMTSFLDVFTNRQLVALNTFSDLLGEVRDAVRSAAISNGYPNQSLGLSAGGCGAQAYAEAISVYLSFLLNQVANHSTSVCGWNSTNAQMRSLFARQAIPMVWDFAESNPFSESSGSYHNLFERQVKGFEALGQGVAGIARQEDAAIQDISINKVVSTDPPYYDNIGYADLSDFFYLWLRRSLKEVFPDLFSTMAVPKTEELVATPHRHGGKQKAETFFLNGMKGAMSRISKSMHPAFPLTIYYAFKQSETDDAGTGNTGWETFLEAIVGSGFCIDGTWPIRTEKEGRVIGNGANALASSIVIVCKPRPNDSPTVSRRDFLKELKSELGRCPVSCDHVPRRSWALFRARDVMRGVIESFKAEQAA